MSGTSRKSGRKTSKGTTSATSSQESRDGPSPCSLPAGTQLDLFGPPPVPASPSPPLGKAKVRKTRATSGRFSPPSSASVSLTSSLGSRLQALLDVNGSMEYELTWSRKSTPSGLRIFRLRASARPTSASGCSGWPTATTNDSKNAPYQQKDGMRFLTLPGVALLAGYPTPDAQDFGSGDSRWQQRREEIRAKGINGNDFGLTLGMAAQLLPELAGWATPMAGTPATEEYNAAGNNDFSRSVEAQLAGWASPTCQDAANVAGPSQMERNSLPLNPQVLTTGPTSSSAPAPTARRVVSRLNPGFSLWLQGFPETWSHCSPGWQAWEETQRLLALYYARQDETAPDACGAAATPSCPPSPPSGSEP